MKSDQDYNTKAVACLTKVRRTFVLTFALMFLTLTVMYGTMETFSEKMLVYRNVSAFKATVSSPLAAMVNLQKVLTKFGNQTYISEYNSSFVSDQKIIKSEKAQSALKSDSLKSEQQITVSSKKTASSIETTDIVQGYQGNGSDEFPGMPDPCATPRRNTGVEDVLCMVG